MAVKRMISKKIVDQDDFLDMPTSTRLLYMDLNIRADDDGFVGSPKKIIRMTGASDDDYKILIAKKFIIEFQSRVCVIKHWLIHNTLKKDRYNPTLYQDEMRQLMQTDTKTYELLSDNKCFQNVPLPETQYSIDKDSIDKDSIDKDSIDNKVNKFTPPTSTQVQEYMDEIGGCNFDADYFVDYNESRGWMVGKNKMKDWKAAVRNWKRNQKEKSIDGDDGSIAFWKNL